MGCNNHCNLFAFKIYTPKICVMKIVTITTVIITPVLHLTPVLPVHHQIQMGPPLAQACQMLAAP